MSIASKRGSDEITGYKDDQRDIEVSSPIKPKALLKGEKARDIDMIKLGANLSYAILAETSGNLHELFALAFLSCAPKTAFQFKYRIY